MGVGTAEGNVEVGELFQKNNYDNMKHICCFRMYIKKTLPQI